MIKTNFSLELKNHFPPSEWSWVLLALRQDQGVWRAVEETDLGARALESLPPVYRAWSPAALVLLALQNPFELESLLRTPLQPLEESLSLQASKVYEEWVKDQRAPRDLVEAGLLALTFREQFRLDGSWKQCLRLGAIEPSGAPTVFACLFGMVPEPLGLLEDLSTTNRPDLVRLAVHSLLANPAPPESQLQILTRLSTALEPSTVLVLLQTLAAYRSHLAALLARQVRDRLVETLTAGSGAKSAPNEIGQLEQLIQTLRIAQVDQIAGQSDLAVPVLSDSLRTMRKMRAHMSAQLARSVAKTKDLTAESWGNTAQAASVEAWKQAVQLTPDDPRYAAGYARALQHAGRIAEATEFIKSYLSDASRPLNPELLLIFAFGLESQGDGEGASQAALGALEKFKDVQSLTEADLAALAGLLEKKNLLAEALEAVRLGLTVFPGSRDLLAHASKLEFLQGKPAEAVTCAYAAQAAELYQAQLGEAKPDEALEEEQFPLPGVGLVGKGEVQRLLVDGLEALNAWGGAYEERLKLMQGQADPAPEELFALATCAAGAGKHAEAAQICQGLLKHSPDQVAYHQLLAEASNALGDHRTAINHFSKAVQLEPENAEGWKGLFKAQKEAGLEAEAVETLRQASQALPEDADIQVKLGEIYLAQGAPTLALPCLRRALAASASVKETQNATIRLGETLFQLGRLDEARQTLEPLYQTISQATSTSSDFSFESDPVAITPQMGFVFARTLLKLNEPEKAIPILTGVVRSCPTDPGPCLDLARALMILGDPASGARRALPFLQKCLGIGPDGSPGGYESLLEDDLELRAEARMLLAEAYSNAGEWEKGLEAFRAALEEPGNRDPDRQTRLALGLGMNALKLELPEMAVAALQEAAQSEPLNAQLHKSLCEAYLATGLAQDAVQAARTALELAPNDLGGLCWFIDQGARLLEQPGMSKTQLQTEVIQALRAALEQAPDRADLLLRLGNLMFNSGKLEEALEAFRKLAMLDTALQKISAKELYQAGAAVFQAGDARLAVILLRKSLHQIEVVGDQDVEPVVRIGLFETLVKALETLGELDEALKGIGKAIALDPMRLDFYYTQADLLMSLGRNEEARAVLDEAIKRWPDDPGLRYRQARLLRTAGDLSAALQQVEQAIASLDETAEDHIGKDLFELAARLAFTALRPRRAFAYLTKAVPETDPDYGGFEQALFRAELALEAGEQEAAVQAVQSLSAQLLESARALAIRGRVAYRRGDREAGDRDCQAAVRQWMRQQMNQPGVEPATSKDEFIAELTSIGMAALENRQWSEALSIFRQMVVMFPEEPLAHFKLAEALLVRAEAQALCQDFEVVQHAPGAEMLADGAQTEFEKSLREAASKAGCVAILQPEGLMQDWDVEIKRSIGLCARRGKALYAPTLENAAALEFLLQTIMPDIEDIVALVMAYRRCGAHERAVKSAEVGWHPTFDGRDFRSDPSVIVQFALLEPDAHNAVQMLNNLLEDPGLQANGWPAPAMLKFLTAKIYYRHQDNQTAFKAVEAALSEWPEEPRWQAFAARILSSRPDLNRVQQLASAIGYYEKAAALEPDHSDHRLQLGQIYLESGQARQALQYLNQVTRQDPRNPLGWLAQARAQFQAGDMDQAALSAEKAIEHADDPVEALLLRAEIALQTKNYRGALGRLQTILRSDQGHPQALYLSAKALEGLDRPAEALEAIERALPAFENPIPVQLERLQLIKRSRGLEWGLKALQELVAQNPRQAAFLALLADWLKETGKLDAAMQAARLALQEELEGLTLKQRADLHTMIGLHMRQSGQLDQAIHHLSEAIALSSDHLDAYLELGRVYQERREYQQALKIYQKAINVAGDDHRPYYQAGMVLKDNKDYMAAEAMLRRAAQIAPNEVSVHRLLGAVVALNLVHSRRLIPGETR